LKETDVRWWSWFLIILIILICVVLPYFRYQQQSTKIKQRIEAGVIKEGEEKATFVKLGLDLAGGVDLLYRADPPPGSKEQEIKPEQMAGVVETVRRRVDPEGVKEVVVQQIGINRLSIQIPGEKDPERTKQLIGKTALLQFIDAGDKAWYEGDKIVVLAEGEEPPSEEEVAEEEKPVEESSVDAQAEGETKPEEGAEAAKEGEEKKPPEREKNTYYVPRDKVILEGSMLKSATLDVGDYGGYQVDIEFNRQGGRLFAEHTARNVGKYLAIILDGQVISCPVIRSVIPHGRGVISGNFSAEDANDLSTLLQSGALPVPLTILQSRTVGPTLGQESIDLSIKAAIFGLSLVGIFMLVYYRFVGLMADMALAFYGFICMGLMSALGVTLTLPGIAGFILSVGMAVDANIIVFERIKEELNSGKTYKASIEAGFRRAFPAILDGNVTTLMAGIVLYMMGSGTIKGFAVTLNLGILVSMFTALVVTKNLIWIWSGNQSLQRPALYGWFVRPEKSGGL
jgi:preprotein translocase subunit SecD